MLKSIWRFCGSVKITFWLLLLISFNLALGSYYIKFYPDIFKSLNNFLFQDWFRLYGQKHLDKIWWLGMLLGLIFVLGINTGVCILNELINLWPKQKQMGSRIFFLKIVPLFIHLCFMVILTGHFLSLVSGFNHSFLIERGANILLPTGANVEILEKNCDYYQTPILLKGFVKQCTVFLKFQISNKTILEQISFLHPCFWRGYSFHLKAYNHVLNLDKKREESPKLKLQIKHDPGLKLILPGFSVMILLMLWYFPQINKK